MAVNVNENGSIKDLGVRSNLDWNGIEYLGQQPCEASLTTNPVFDLPRTLSDYKYMILFGHINNGFPNAEKLCAGILVFSPVDVYNNHNHMIYVGFIPNDNKPRVIEITDITISQLTTFRESHDGSYQRLYGIY